jgi:predicted ATPase
MPRPASGEDYVFVSYASVDRERVLSIVDALRSRSVPAWIDVADISGGASYGPEIATGIKDSKALILSCSDASLASRNVRQEIQLAWRYERPILPLLLHPLSFPDDLAYWLEGAQWIELFGPGEETWLYRLMNALALHGLSPSGSRGPAAIGTREVSDEPRIGNLRAPAGDVFGRDRELRQLQSLLANGNVVTVTGPGGAGKTQLSLEAATRTRDAYPGGIWFVDASTARVGDELVTAIQSTLGVDETAGESPVDAITRRLEGASTLLLLDNLEQVSDAATAIQELGDRLPELRILCTSRSPVRIPGEMLLAISGLSVPSSDRLVSASELSQTPAVALFVSAARRARPEFMLTDGNAQAVAAICARLDGLPLALELAAARCRLLPPALILERLEQSLDLLTRGANSLTDRQRTLRGTIGWSYELLGSEEQAVFRSLSVFAGGSSIDAIQAVSGDTNAVDSLEELIDQSLIQTFDSGVEDQPRVRMLETIRQFAFEELTKRGEVLAAQDRHARHYLSIAEHTQPRIAESSDASALALLDLEESNLREAFRYFGEIDSSNDGDHELRLAWSLWRYWWIRGRYSEATTRLENAIDRHPEASPKLLAYSMIAAAAVAESSGKLDHAVALADRAMEAATRSGDTEILAHALDGRGTAAEARGDYRKAREDYDKALDLYRELGDERGMAVAMHRMASIATMTGDYEIAREFASESLSIWRKRGETQNVSYEIQQLGILTFLSGDYSAAAKIYEESVSLSETLGDQLAIGNGLLNLGSALEMAGELDGATHYLHRAMPIFEQIGDFGGVGYVQYLLGHVARRRNDLPQAEQFLHLSFVTLDQVGDRASLALVLETLAGTSLDSGLPHRAARLFGAADRLREDTGAALPPSRITEFAADQEALRAIMDKVDLETAWAEGRNQPSAELI